MRNRRIGLLILREFDTALIGFADLDEDALSRPWRWRDGRMDVRYALYRTLEEAQEALVRVAAGTHPETRASEPGGINSTPPGRGG